jgi:hypothetical protein
MPERRLERAKTRRPSRKGRHVFKAPRDLGGEAKRKHDERIFLSFSAPRNGIPSSEQYRFLIVGWPGSYTLLLAGS